MKIKILDSLLNRSANSSIKAGIHAVKNKIGNQPRKTPGVAEVLGWNIGYIDNLALLSSLEVLVQKGWNDFTTQNPTPLILDCGANIGISVLNYKRKIPNAKVIAFEPDPSIIPVLKRNLTANRATNVTLVEAAVWVKAGELDFYVEGADGSRLTAKSQEGSVKVKTVDLLDYMESPIDLIKMDIEGAELEVIPHIKNRLGLVQNLIVECHINGNQAGKLGFLLETLADAGFHVHINSMGKWRDLMRSPAKLPHEFDQYFLVAATKAV